MHRYQLANLTSHFRACFSSGFHSSHVTIDDNRDQPVSNFFATNDGHVGSLDHGISCSQCSHVPLGFQSFR